MAPLVSEVAIPELEIEKEDPTKLDLMSTTEESPAVSTSEPETSYAFEGTTAHHSHIAESGSPDDENAVDRSETIEPRTTEAEHMFSPAEDKTDFANGKTSDSALILAAAEQLPDVASQEIFQPQSSAVLVTEDDNRESTRLEGHGTAENIEAKDLVKEVNLTCFFFFFVNILLTGLKKAKHDLDPVPVLANVNNIEHEVQTDAATTTNDLAAAVLPEKEQPVAPTTEVLIFYSCGNALADLVLPRKDDSIKHLNEAAIVAVGLAAVKGSSGLDKVVPEGIHEGTPEARNDSVESGTTLNLEAQREHEVDVTNAREIEDTQPDDHRNDATPVPQPLEPGSCLIKTELVDERQVETTSSATSVLVDKKDQLDPSLVETAPNAEKDVEEVQTQVDDTSNIKDEPIPESDVAQHIEAADTEGPLEDASTKESQITVQLEPDVDSVLPVEEEPSTISQVVAEDLLPKIESEGTTSQTSFEIIPIPEDSTAPVPDVEEQIIAPVDVRSEHDTVVAHEVETEVEAEVEAETPGTDAATATNDLAASEPPETEQPVVPTTEVFIFYSCGNVLADPVLFL